MTAKTRWTVGFDADDTLWHNEKFFRLTQEHFANLLQDSAEADDLQTRLVAAERRNLGHYGYGIKGFVLSMIETAIDVTDGRVPARVISELIGAGREMLRHPIELLPGVDQAIGRLKGHARLVLVTKGDLLDQERKLAQSGLGEHFDGVEIVSEKTPSVYSRVFAGAPCGLMAGNSLRSDVLPAIAAGVHGVHIPHALTWEVEAAEPPENDPLFHRIPDLGALPDLVFSLS